MNTLADAGGGNVVQEAASDAVRDTADDAIHDMVGGAINNISQSVICSTHFRRSAA